MERIVMQLVLEEAARMHTHDEEIRLKQLEVVVQTGVAKAFGAK